MIPNNNYKKKKFKYSNCYGFALDISTPDIFLKTYWDIEIDDFFLNPGFTSFKTYSFSKSGMLENVDSDLDNLGIKYFDSSIGAPNIHGGYKIDILFENGGYHIHFIRQNIDGTWSEKVGYSKKLEHLKTLMKVIIYKMITI